MNFCNIYIFFLPSFRATMALPISRRDSLLEKEAMFRDSGGALTQQPSLDNGLDGPYPSTAGKLEQVRGERRTFWGKECVKTSRFQSIASRNCHNNLQYKTKLIPYCTCACTKQFYCVLVLHIQSNLSHFKREIKINE